MRLKLFCEVPTGEMFFYGDQPKREFVKVDEKSSLALDDGFNRVHPHVLVFQKNPKPTKSIYDRIGGDNGLSR